MVANNVPSSSQQLPLIVVRLGDEPDFSPGSLTGRHHAAYDRLTG